MLSGEQIREKSFEKAIFGGYDTAQVDSFMKSVAQELETLQNEKNEINEKLKVVLDRVVEYQRDEAAVHDALLRAQRVANEIITEAEGRAKEITDKAQTKHAEIVEATRKITEDKKQEYLRDLSVDLKRLEDCRRATAEFVGKITRTYEIQIDRLRKLSDLEPHFEIEAASAIGVIGTPKDILSEFLASEAPAEGDFAKDTIRLPAEEMPREEEALTAVDETPDEPEPVVAEQDPPQSDEDEDIAAFSPFETEEDPDIKSASFDSGRDALTDAVAAIKGSIEEKENTAEISEKDNMKDMPKTDRSLNFRRGSETVENGMHTRIVEVTLAPPEPEPPKQRGFRFGHEALEEDTIPNRPTFDFDNLQFGDNYDPGK